MENNKQKYLKYKTKYVNLKNTIQKGGNNREIIGIDGQTYIISDELFEQCSSWILFTLREVMGDSLVRNFLINSFVTESKIPNFYDIEMPFEALRQNNTTVTKLCKNIIANNTHNIFIFTGTNLPDKITRETHYNIFIVDKINKTVRAIDPAIKPKNKMGIQRYGIYHPFLALETIFPFFIKNGYTTDFIQLKNPAQTSHDDVFCQTWTLIILELWLSLIATKGIDNRVEFSPLKIKKYNILLEFYKKIIFNYPDIATMLNENYINNINITRKDYLNEDEEDINVDNVLAQINPSMTLINYFKPEDLL
jgi:hypothetical protein